MLIFLFLHVLYLISPAQPCTEPERPTMNFLLERYERAMLYLFDTIPTRIRVRRLNRQIARRRPHPSLSPLRHPIPSWRQPTTVWGAPPNGLITGEPVHIAGAVRASTVRPPADQLSS